MLAAQLCQGLAAKPVIDLFVQLRNSSQLAAAIRALEGCGYRHEGDLGVPGREAFAVPDGEARHHLYVCLPDCRQLEDQLAFRDYLRAHADTRDAYASLKRRLSIQHHENRDAYTDGKAAFVADVLSRALR